MIYILKEALKRALLNWCFSNSLKEQPGDQAISGKILKALRNSAHAQYGRGEKWTRVIIHQCYFPSVVLFVYPGEDGGRERRKEEDSEMLRIPQSQLFHNFR